MLQKTKRGMAARPFSASTDLFYQYATYTQPGTNSFPFLPAFTTLLTNIINDNIPTPIHPYFASQYVLALHKDPDDLNKLWPIGIGTALRCLAASLITTIYATDFATYLIPNGQFGIACPGSLNFIYHTMQAQMELLLADPDHNSHALLLLDIVNMFNAVSRDACRMTLASHPVFSALLPFFDLLYMEANQCWVRMTDGSYTTILQHEGFTQGCPLSPFLACIVLAILTRQIIEELKK